MRCVNKQNDYPKKFSIGIPTYEAGESLVSVVNSLVSQTVYSQIDKILIAVDGNSIPEKILSNLKNKKVEIAYFKNRKGQSARINDIFKILNTQKIVLTNDDVKLDKNSLEFINKKYSKFDLIAGNVQPLKEKNLFGKSLIIGQKLRVFVSNRWNGGNNYLSCNGRLIILSKDLYKKITIPEKIWNNDAYIYLTSQQLKLKFAFAPEITAYYKSPSALKEHLSQSSKFQKSTVDLQRYFKTNISKFYKIPTGLLVKSVLVNFLNNPILASTYLVIFLFTRFRSFFIKQEFKLKGFWETDLSTKTMTN